MIGETNFAQYVRHTAVNVVEVVDLRLDVAQTLHETYVVQQTLHTNIGRGGVSIVMTSVRLDLLHSIQPIGETLLCCPLAPNRTGRKVWRFIGTNRITLTEELRVVLADGVGVGEPADGVVLAAVGRRVVGIGDVANCEGVEVRADGGEE